MVRRWRFHNRSSHARNDPAPGIHKHTLLSQLRFKIAEETDKRIQIMSELVSSIEVVKMYVSSNSYSIDQLYK